MRTIREFTIVPTLPPELEPLRLIAFNLWWSWSHDAIALFRRLDRELWARTEHNPVRMLGLVDQARLQWCAEDESFIFHMERVARALEVYMSDLPWFEKTQDSAQEIRIGYFSAEYGLATALPIYSGGLGVLAGDHLKAASDLGLPLVAVGLLYRQGYFRQYLNADGWQQERYPDFDFYNCPIEKLRQPDGTPWTTCVKIGGRDVVARIWLAQVGRVPLYLLDTNHKDNAPVDRELTARLYGGDLDMRIRQEILLGIGGYRALVNLGIEPTVCHMNEGHSAFLALERARLAMERHGLDFLAAREATAPGNVFTTHTPVPAGNDRFPADLVMHHFKDYAATLHLEREDFLALGRENPEDSGESYCMTVLAIKMAERFNGVSKLHGHVSRRMWQGLWPELPQDEIPIQAITNGVHTKTWISEDMASLLDRYLGPRWGAGAEARGVWKQVHEIPDEELWRTHERRRERLVAFARRRLRAQLESRGAARREVRLAEEVLNPEALTIGFARRFAPYKRATLLLRDRERLIRILGDRDRPVQLIIAGKAHPHDNEGKSLLREIVHAVRDGVLRRRVVFLEDYDMAMARYMLQGVDVWLNTPRRPLEASGTSGMKAAVNGALNMSVLDGWWCEAYDPRVGWAIGGGEEYKDIHLQDEVESNAAYDMLEKEIVPLFYDRPSDDLPRKWVHLIKDSMSAICPNFSTNRMVGDYLERAYRPAHLRRERLVADSFARARALSLWKERVRNNWARVGFEKTEVTSDMDLHVGDEMKVTATVTLGGLEPEDVSVELYVGQLAPDDKMADGHAVRMEERAREEGGRFRFEGTISCRASGRHGLALRIMPRHEDLSNPYGLNMVKWA